MAKKKKETAQDWQQKIKEAKKAKDNWREKFRIDLSYEFYEGRQKPSYFSADEWITINLIWSELQAELPTLYSTDPYYYIHVAQSYSVDPNDLVLYEQKARTRQSYLNYLKKELQLKPKIRMSILDTYFQFGIVKCNYSTDLIENPKAGEPITDDVGMIIDPDTMQPLLEPEYLPTNGSYKVTRIHPNDFFVDADAGPLNDEVSWKAHRFKKKLEDVQNDTRYNAKARRKVKATEISDEPDKLKEDRQKGSSVVASDKKKPDLVVLYEIYDLINDKMLLIAEDCEDYLLEPQALPIGIEKDPFVDLRFSMRDASWYPIPPISQWIDPQKDYCELRSKVKTHRKRFNRKYELDAKSYTDPENAAAHLTTGDDGTVLIKDGMSMGQSVTPIADAPLDQQIHMEYGYLRQDFMELAMGPNQRGATAGVDSATEAGILEKRTVIREGDRLGLVTDFMKDIGRKIDQLVQANLDKTMAVKVTGPEGESWEKIDPADYQDINGEYEYSLDVGATTPQLPEIERAQWLAFLNLMAAAPQLASSKQILPKTAEMFHIYDKVLVEEVNRIAITMMQAQMQGGAAQGGSTPNVQPMTGEMGAAMGINNIRGGNTSAS